MFCRMVPFSVTLGDLNRYFKETPLGPIGLVRHTGKIRDVIY